MGSPTFPPETYTPVEHQRIDELRTKLSDLELSEELLDSAHLIRWLRARSMNVEKANEMLRNSLEWRKSNGVDGILEREKLPEDFKKMSPIAYVGLDKNGYPILLAPAGRRDARLGLEKYGWETCHKVNFLFNETMMEFLRTVSKEQGRTVTQMVHIIDMEGFSYRQFGSKQCREFMAQAQSAFNDNYPEILHYAMIINAPKAFHIIWTMFKPLIPKETLDKMDVFGVDKDKWMKVIAERFPLDKIPPHWGGTREGVDEYCSGDGEIWSMMGNVERSFFNYNKPYPPTNEDEDASSNLMTTTISSRNSLKIRLCVAKPNSSIAWRFRTEHHDIGFQIVNQDGKELLPLRKVKSQKDKMEEGQQQCQTPGIHTVTFDNSYSWARSKTVHYNVSVILPEGEEEVQMKLEEELESQINGNDVLGNGGSS